MPDKRLLIFHQGALGDIVVAFPALAELRKRYPVIHGICKGEIGELACRLGVFDRAFSIESAIFSTLFSNHIDSKLTDILNAYDALILFSFSAELETAVRRVSSGTVFRIPPRPDPSRRIHVAWHIAKNLIAKGLVGDALLRGFDEKGRYTRNAGSRGRNGGLSKVLIHFGSGSPRKNWPLSNFKQVYKILSSMNKETAFIVGPAEIHMRPALQGYKRFFPRNLMELAELLRTAEGYIGNDSGVTHLAAYLGIPTVAIFGPSDPIRWHPMGDRVRVVSFDYCAISPCFENENEKRQCDDCMKGIEPDSVVAAFQDLFICNYG